MRQWRSPRHSRVSIRLVARRTSQPTPTSARTRPKRASFYSPRSEAYDATPTSTSGNSAASFYSPRSEAYVATRRPSASSADASESVSIRLVARRTSQPSAISALSCSDVRVIVSIRLVARRTSQRPRRRGPPVWTGSFYSPRSEAYVATSTCERGTGLRCCVSIRLVARRTSQRARPNAIHLHGRVDVSIRLVARRTTQPRSRKVT